MLGEEISPHQHRHAACDFAHGLEEREAVVDPHGLVGDAGRAGFLERLGERTARSEVQVGEEDLVFAEERIFLREWLFDFHHHVGASENLGVAGDNFRTGLTVVVIAETNSSAGLGFYDDLVAMFDELICSGRKECHAILLGFDFFGDSDDHGENMNPKLFLRKRFLA